MAMVRTSLLALVRGNITSRTSFFMFAANVGHMQTRWSAAAVVFDNGSRHFLFYIDTTSAIRT